MENVAFVTGADRGLGYAICQSLVQIGWRVIAGQYMEEWPQLAGLRNLYPDQLDVVPLDVASMDSVFEAATVTNKFVEHIDVLINNAGVSTPTMRATIREPQDYAEMHRLYDVNALGPLRVVEAFLSLMDLGQMRRLCFVSSEAGSIGSAKRESWYAYTMSKAALNMGVKTLFNSLRPDGYTFRLYHPGWIRSYMGGTKSSRGDMEPEEAAQYALRYFIDPLDPIPDEPQTDPEDRLVLRDWLQQDWPW